MKRIILMAFIGWMSLVGMAFGQNTLAHVDTQKVLDTMPSRAKAAAELEKFQNKAIDELRDAYQKLQGDIAKLQQERNTMSPTAYKFEEDRLSKKSQDFQERQQELDEQIQALSMQLNAPILQRVQDAVSIVSKAQKIDYVIDQSNLLYSNGRDITNAVITEVLKLENESETQK